MNLFQKLDHHTTLMNRMADTVGADLGGAILDGRLSGSALRGMVVSCCACEGAGDCPGWLEAHPQAEAAPGYCRNRIALAALKG
jgi:hypothetical protein